MKKKKVITLFFSCALALSVFTGCASVQIDKNASAAVLDEEEISMGIANFAARVQQAQYDDFYTAYFGEKVWSSDLYGNGTKMEDNLKDGVIESIRDLYLLKNHMSDYGVSLSEEENTAIANAAAEFISANTNDALDALGADEDIVKEYLTLVTIQKKMYDAIVADADTNVSDEDANTSAYSYVYISKTTGKDAEGNTVEYTDEDKEMLLNTVNLFAAAAKNQTLETAAEEYDYTVTNGTFASDTTLDENVLTALKALQEGEVSDVVETDSAYYVLRLDAQVDEQATAERRAQIISERESTLYTDVLDEWKEASEWTLYEKEWEKVTFDNLFTTIVETDDAAESLDSTQTLDSTEEE